MSSFDLRKFLTENKLTPNTQGYKIIPEEKKPVQKEAFAPIKKKPKGKRNLSELGVPGADSLVNQAKTAFKVAMFDHAPWSKYESLEDSIGVDHGDRYYDQFDAPIMGDDFKYPLEEFDIKLGSDCYARFSGTVYYSAYEEDGPSFDVEVTGWDVDCVIYRNNEEVDNFTWNSDEEENLYR